MRKATLRKPVPDTAQALNFATGVANEGKAGPRKRRGRAPSGEAGQSRSGQVPKGDARLGANIKEELHLKLRMAAATRRATIGEILEELIEKHL